MEYVLLDMNWNMSLNVKGPDYDIKQLAAIHIDEKLHTLSKFYRLNSEDNMSARRIAYMMDSGDDAIMDLETAWEEFREWIPENAAFIIWNSEIKHIIRKCNKKFRRQQLRTPVIDLQVLQEAMLPVPDSKKPIEDVMTALGLRCDRTRMMSALYSAQCMLRLYRKLWKEGMKHFDFHQWETLLLNGNFSMLQKADFFPQIAGKQLRTQCLGIVMKFCWEKEFHLYSKGTLFEIETAHAVWRFDLLNKGRDLIYMPKRYVQIWRHDMKMKTKMGNTEDLLQEIFTRIASVDERLAFGVGSEEVEEVVGRLLGGTNK